MTATSPSVVTVRYWAGARAAAGVAEEARRPGSVSDVLAEARIDHPALEPVLAVATTLLDGVAVDSDAQAEAGSVLEILPPFAGG